MHLVLRTIRAAALGLALFATLRVLLFTAMLVADQIPQEAFNTFPADTLQVAFTNLAELRSQPAYSQIRERIMNRQLRAFQDFSARLESISTKTSTR